MITPDTNVIVRLLVEDDPAQAERARALFASESTFFLAVTILLETEWVLRYAYDFPAPAIARALRRLCGLPNVNVENDHIVAQALTWHEAGLDFADALHLAVAANTADGQGFVTFDKKLVKKARPLAHFPVELV
jgi:predicted nucleic-acid-binding protein